MSQGRGDKNDLATRQLKWLECIQNWYPELHSKTYFLPPLHFNSLPYEMQEVAGNPTLVVQKPTDGKRPSSSKSPTERDLPSVLDKDVRADRAQKLVLLCLRAMATTLQLVMMVISQLKFGQYLNKPAFAASAALFPTIKTLPAEHKVQCRQGDFDVLIIDSKCGLVTGEVKSVGSNFRQLGKKPHEENQIILSAFLDAEKQLKKAETVLEHLVSDVVGGVKITKVAMMPYVKMSRLMQVLKNAPTSPETERFKSRSFDVENNIAFLLCEEHLSENDPTQICEWWKKHFPPFRYAKAMDRKLYESLVCRFCGPATTVEIFCLHSPRLELRTQGDAIAEVGDRMTKIVLLPEQVNLLNDNTKSQVFLAGPPGTGKTILLLMKGLTCLQTEHEVHIVSMWSKARAASIMIKDQLEKSMRSWDPMKKVDVHRHMYRSRTLADVICSQARRRRRKVCVLVDEAGPANNDTFEQFCKAFIDKEPEIVLWAAAVQHAIRPRCLEEVKLTIPLRSPPVVVKEIMKAEEIQGKKSVDRYDTSYVPAAADGPEVKLLHHSESKDGHIGQRPYNCVKCGRNVAKFLTEIQVGQQTTVPGGGTRRMPLKFSDVLILCDNPTKDQQGPGQAKSSAIGLVQGLEECKVPVLVVKEDCDEKKMTDVALSREDKVTVTHWNVVRGLERKVVVVVAGYYPTSGIDVFNRLQGASRCSSQLVLLDWR